MKLVAPSSSPVRVLCVAAAGLAMVLSNAACGGDDATTSAAPAGAGTTSPGGSPAAAVTITDAWVRAADSGMTAAFGVLRNTSGNEVTIVSASSPVSPRMELHEVVAGAGSTMQMRPKASGIVLPPGGTHEFTPGGDHLMFMSLTKPIKPGDDVAITLTTATGTTIPVTAPGRAFTGGNEEYAPGAHPSPMTSAPTASATP